jgi:probable phosphoglycerate mutase
MIRHAQSEGNAIRMLQGQFNSPLSSIGISQAKLLQTKLDFPYDVVFASPLDRAYHTAQIALEGGYNGQIILHEGLKEMDFGNYQQISFNDFTEHNWKIWDRIVNEPNFKEHGGESRNEFFSRISKSIEGIIIEATRLNCDKVAVFTHGGVIRVIFENYLQIDKPTVSNTQIMRFDVKNGKLQFRSEIS